MARTETAPLSINPDFLNNIFILRLPQAVGATLQPRVLLSVQLWSAPESLEVRCHFIAQLCVARVTVVRICLASCCAGLHDSMVLAECTFLC
jgi:hypothetical protein